jgi:hypothetical protein
MVAKRSDKRGCKRNLELRECPKNTKSMGRSRNIAEKDIQEPDGSETFCGERYMHPPTEDWIQCGVCLEWANEDCTDNTGLGDIYKCNFCVNRPN